MTLNESKNPSQYQLDSSLSVFETLNELKTRPTTTTTTITITIRKLGQSQKKKHKIKIDN